MRSIFALAVTLEALLSFACGGSRTPADANASSTEAPGDDADATEHSTANEAKEEPPATNDEPILVACEAKPVSCSEAKMSGGEIAKSKERCAAAGGEPREGACSRDAVIATCDVAAKALTILFYTGTTAETTAGIMRGAKSSCEAAGGTFTPARTGG